MNVVKTILLVVFVLVCVFLVLLVLIQNDEDNGMGGVFGGGQSTAFGARSASVLTKTTGVFVVLFFIIAFVISLLNKPSTRNDLNEAARQIQGETLHQESGSWLEEELFLESSAEEDTSEKNEVIESTTEDANVIEITPSEVQTENVRQEDAEIGSQVTEGEAKIIQIDDSAVSTESEVGETEEGNALQESAESDEVLESLE